jgi:hypothetical protein
VNTALVQALLNAQSNALGNGSPDSFDVLTSNDLTESGSDDVVAQGKGLIGDLAGAKVLSRKGSDKGGRLAVRVKLGVDGADVERGHHIRAEFGADHTAIALSIEDAILGDHFGDQAAGCDDLELGRAGMNVESVHTACINPAQSHTSTSSNESRECLAVGSNELATETRVLLLLVEVENEILIIGEESEAIGSSVSQTELSSQAEFIAGALVVRSSAGERGQSQEGRGEDSVGDHIGYEIWMICWARTASLGLKMGEVLSWEDAEGMSDE